MTAAGDDGNEMGTTDILSDEAIEAFLVGEPHPGWQEDEALAAIDTGLAELAALPAPPVGSALARLMRPAPAASIRSFSGVERTPQVRSTPQNGWHTPPARPYRPRARRVMAGVGAGLALAGVALPVAAATHVLPAPAREAVVQVLEAVTPFEFDSRPASPKSGPPTTTPALPADPSAGPAAGTPAVPAPPASVPTTAGPPASTPAGVVPGPPAGVTPGNLPVVPGGPPAGVDPGPPGGTTPGPPSEALPVGPTGPGTPEAPGRPVAGSTPTGARAGAAPGAAGAAGAPSPPSPAAPAPPTAPGAGPPAAR
ncbi:MAG: hypothetical protein ACLGI2_03705 [Acidimicrobiia bacterium]